EDGIRDRNVTGVQTCALPIFPARATDTGPGRSKPRPNASMAIGGGLVVLIVGLALVSFLWTPYDPSDIDPIARLQSASHAHPLRSEERRVGKERGPLG